jgi:chromate transporter
MNDGLVSFALYLLILSLLAIGGINPIVPELQRFLVVEHGWISNEDFVALFALAQAAPGPNVIFVTLLGWQLGSLAGAALATLAICGPAVIIAYLASGLSLRWQATRWFVLLRRSLTPLTTGMMIASAWLLTDAATSNVVNLAITGVAAVFVLTTRMHPLLPLAGGAVIGILGWV